MKLRAFSLIIIALAFASTAFATTDFAERAREIHASALLVDGHNDLPWALREKNDMGLTKFNLTQFQPQFHTDIPRLRKGGMGAQFWSAYVPTSLSPSQAVKVTREQIDLIHRMIEKYDAFEFAGSTEDILRAFKNGRMASLIGVEGGHSINNSLEILRELYEKGARYMTLAHNRNTSWIESCTDKALPEPLTPFGEKVVWEMNRLGMLVDISHISAKAMKEVLAVTKAPVIASHSSAYAIYNHVRNVPDDVLERVAENGGVMMVNFYTHFVGAPANVGTVVNHIEHIIKVAGIDHVGLGSDYDGVPALPVGLEDVSKFPNITEELLRRGYSETDIRKVLGENVMRAFKKVEEIALSLGS